MKKQLLLIFIFSLSLSWSQNTSKKEIYQKAKVYYNSINEWETLDNAGIALDHGKHKPNHHFTSVFSQKEIQLIKNLGFTVAILKPDMHADYLLRKKEPASVASCSEEGNYDTPTNFNLGSMGGFLTYEELQGELDAMRSLYPNLISEKAPIGTFLTEEGRPIQWLRISDNPDIEENEEPEILYTAIHHAREPASLSQTIFYMWYLLENYDTDSEIQALVNTSALYFVPLVNPDGYVYNQTTNPNGGGYWRKNRRDHGNGFFGVDNNRNYDYWENGDVNQSIWNTTGVSNNTNGATFPGTNAFSEVENQAIKFFVENHSFKAASNAHTYSELLLYPFGYDYNLPTPDNTTYENTSSILVRENGYDNIISSGLYPASGDSDDYMYGQTQNHNKIFAFTPEIGTEFWPVSDAIIPICKEMLFYNIHLAKMIHPYADISTNTTNYIGGDVTYTENTSILVTGFSETPANFTISIDPISPEIINVSGPITISNAAINSSYNYNYSIDIASGTPNNTELVYDITINNGLFDTKKRIRKTYGVYSEILFDACENSTTTAFTSSDWGFSSDAFSGSAAYTDSPNSNYSNNANTLIALEQSIDLANDGISFVQFKSKWDLETGYDYVQLEISTDQGSTWSALCGKYTVNSENNTPIYEGLQEEWIIEEIDLSDYNGASVLFRFVLQSDEFETRDGFYFDDFYVYSSNSNSLSVDESEIASISLHPNPSKGNFNITLLQENAVGTIYNIQGKKIKTITLQQGINTVDMSNYSTGIYLLTVSNSNTKQNFKLIKN